MVVADSLHNDCEFRFERCTADEEAVDIGLRNEIAAVASIRRSTVLDSSGGSDISIDILGQPRSNVSVGVLCDGGRGGLTSANGPDRLVGNDNSAPAAHNSLNCIKLSLEDVIGLVSLSLFESLTNTKDTFESSCLGAFNFLGDNFISLREELSAL